MAGAVAAVVAASSLLVFCGAVSLRRREIHHFPARIAAFHVDNKTFPVSQLNAASAKAPIVEMAARHGLAGSAAEVGVSSRQAAGFQQFYWSYTTGPGIWKWNNALDAYQRHLAPLANQPLKLAEVGVQSGGSCVMWKTVLGAQCHVYGLDINPATSKFQDAMTTITIGDQADTAMWQNFFTSVTGSPIDALIDDGGHESHQMLVTLTSVFDNLTPGGMIFIEDIHGEHYVESFFVPAAQYLGAKAGLGQVSSVHAYPFLLAAKRAGNDMRAPVTFGGSTETVSEFAQLWEALPRHWGGHVVLENPGWGPFLTAEGLTNFFRVFGEMHHSIWHDEPAGCEHTAAAVCSVVVDNGQLQATITGIHIFANRLVVEVAGAQVNLQAVRRGTDWLPY